MAFITLKEEKLRENYEFLNQLFLENNIHWAVVSKILCGNRIYLEKLLRLGPTQVCDSRVSNLKTIKSINPNIETIYIKPPPKRSIKSIVKYADISLNTDYYTLQLLDKEAERVGKCHKVIIMIEMGELREGIMRDDFIDFFSKVFNLEHIDVVGIGTNLSCLYGVLPNADKLIQLSLYKQLIEAKFERKIPLVSGGSSVTIPLLDQNILPKGINHFRVGESIFLGTNVYDCTPYAQMHNDVFRLYSEIIELIEKPLVPEGEMGPNVDGETYEFDERDVGKTSFRAIVDMGLVDVDSKHITPVCEDYTMVGASSDMFVINLGNNEKGLKTGDLIEFKMDYMGVVRILGSKYIEKL